MVGKSGSKVNLRGSFGGDMAKNLVIVESPAKVKTIKKFLGSNYSVVATNGHIRDLPKSQMGIDVAQDFEPKYITIRGKGDIVSKLKKEAKKASKIYLATDPDREGEAIAWHLTYALKLEDVVYKRISFNEITKTAVKAALKSPRDLNQDLVDAQQARRILDRLVGYNISPILWKKIKRGLSAGRVQSATLHLIVERENEVNAFIPEEYWSIEGEFLFDKNRKISGELIQKNHKKIKLISEKTVQEILSQIKDQSGVVEGIVKGERKKQPPKPFTTSTLQQEAAKLLNFATAKTMRIAQQLYEGVDIKGEGTVGIITYLRTDSTRISEEALKGAKDFISETYGKEYLGFYKDTGGKANIQDAHEAIRPTDISRLPIAIKDSLSKDQFKLYQLIWKRFVASQMKGAIYHTEKIDFKVLDYTFRQSSQIVSFDGFLKVYESDEKSDKIRKFSLNEGDTFKVKDTEAKRHETQPPARYTEASLVKALEELGIGRPSTYATTITTLLTRNYITKEKKNLCLTELGEIVDQMVREYFPTITDIHFTANMEKQLDEVGVGDLYWKEILRKMYPDFASSAKKAEEELEKVDIKPEESDEVCELCGKKMVIKYAKFGKFLACPGFPDCKNTKPYFEKIGVTCPQCESDLVLKKTKKGRKYYGCVKSPDCDFMSWDKPVRDSCPKCGHYMVAKGQKVVCAHKECGHTQKFKKGE